MAGERSGGPRPPRDNDDRPYAPVHDSGLAGADTHVLERTADGFFTGYAACGMAPDGWVWSPSGAVTCGRCADAAPASTNGREGAP